MEAKAYFIDNILGSTPDDRNEVLRNEDEEKRQQTQCEDVPGLSTPSTSSKYIQYLLFSMMFVLNIVHFTESICCKLHIFFYNSVSKLQRRCIL